MESGVPWLFILLFKPCWLWWLQKDMPVYTDRQFSVCVQVHFVQACGCKCVFYGSHREVYNIFTSSFRDILYITFSVHRDLARIASRGSAGYYFSVISIGSHITYKRLPEANCQLEKTEKWSPAGSCFISWPPTVLSFWPNFSPDRTLIDWAINMNEFDLCFCHICFCVQTHVHIWA